MQVPSGFCYLFPDIIWELHGNFRFVSEASVGYTVFSYATFGSFCGIHFLSHKIQNHGKGGVSFVFIFFARLASDKF